MRHAIFALTLTASLLATAPLCAAPTKEQQAAATRAEEGLKEAGKLVLAKKYQEAVPLLEQAQNVIAELEAGGADGKKLAGPLDARLGAARRIVEGKGFKLAAPAKPSAPGAGGISFTKQIAPILVARCNNCHVTGTRGGFNMGNFAALMKGSTAGIVVNPGKGDGSRLVEVLDSGDMPRGGGKLSDEQISLISKWIDAGAKFDGKDPTASIAVGLPTPAPTPQLTVAKASGNESIKFSRDIAPVLADQCLGCHGDGQQPAARLSLATFQRLLAGSMNGVILTPGKAADSLIIKKLKGQAGDRMPLRASPLPPETIAKFEKWIAEGAKFDGISATMNVDLVAKVYQAGVMSHEELAKERINIGQQNWKLANPEEKPDVLESENFVLMGNVGDSELGRVRDAAEAQLPKVARMLKAPTTGPLIKGRITLFVFKRRYDYSELGKMVEGREIPPNWHGHWRFNILDSYAGLVPPPGNEYSLNALVGEQIAGTYLDSLSKEGKLPVWFSQGSAWAVGAALDAKDTRVRQWEDAIAGAIASSSKPEDFLEGKLAPGETAALNYSYCRFLMSNSKGYASLLAGLKDKKDFDQAFKTAFGGDPKQVATLWAAKAATAKRGK